MAHGNGNEDRSESKIRSDGCVCELSPRKQNHMFTHRDVCFLVHLELRCWRFFSSCTVGVDVLYLRYALHQRDKKKEMEHRERNVNVIHMIHAVSNVYHRCYDTRNDCHRKMLMMMMSATTVINSRLPKKSSLAKRFNANSAKAGKSKL